MNEDINFDKERKRQVERRRLREKKRQKLKWIRFGVFLVIAIVIGLLSFGIMKNFMMSSVEEPVLSGETIIVTIPQGASTADIANILKENKLIKNTFMFRLSSRLDGFDGTYQQGTYEIDKSLNDTQIMELLQTGVVFNDIKFTVPEGYTTKQIAEKVKEAGICTAEEFIEECNTGRFDFEFLKNLPDRDFKLEGYLFPDTYYIKEETTAHELIEAMLARFEQMYTKEYQNAVSASGYSLDEMVTIASVIEKEIKLDEERPRAAGVIYNRLKDGMPLQVDATVLYAMGIVKEDITTVDLQYDSPYNTYKVTGLPIGPISNPGEASFKAALNPEDNNYIYYIVEAKGQDNHVFCETYDQFLKAKEKYKASGN
ncbi:putative aminodeoxychorismate lyase [Anaerotignum neopropionicum]|uniref:Endolytic murein transglycosylase n=1 Tax=Anaerotignum neopropionicum TaxID=36847 RepID=A0A136WDA9_9FIRM|nr:endolytic transglycosylase MltG [Anaerotignum neopropionicum]KXL52474.1 putative aminodeoxychorismate lyase [Anaerotignum neopropionicum]